MSKVYTNIDQYRVNELSRELRARRQLSGYTLKEYGEAIGVSDRTASDYQSDPDKTTLKVLRRIVKVLHPDPVIILRAIGYSDGEIKRIGGSQ